VLAFLLNILTGRKAKKFGGQKDYADAMLIRAAAMFPPAAATSAAKEALRCT
jgi:hypothetical protein